MKSLPGYRASPNPDLLNSKGHVLFILKNYRDQGHGAIS